MSKKDAKYNFDNNLLNASYSKELDIAKKEWKFICEEKRNITDGLCICQRKVKHVIYMYNIKTRKTICVGSICHKKFNMENSKVNDILSNIFKNFLEKGEYIIIGNVVTYCKTIQTELIRLFENKYEYIKNGFCCKNKWDNGYILEEKNYVPNDLIELSKKIDILIKEYELEYLQDLYLEIHNKINEIYNEREIYEKSKNYSVREYRKNYVPGCGVDYFDKQYYFTSLEMCNEHISKLPNIGVTIYTGHRYTRSEDTYIKYEIIYNNQIIKIIGEQVYEEHKKYIEKYKACEAREEDASKACNQMEEDARRAERHRCIREAEEKVTAIRKWHELAERRKDAAVTAARNRI